MANSASSISTIRCCSDNEGTGISDLVLKNCDFVVKIPMTGKIESLNASVSAAISMYEIVRQKNLKK